MTSLQLYSRVMMLKSRVRSETDSDWLTDKPTPSSRVIPEKLTVPKSVKRFPAHYGTCRFTVMFTRACHAFPSYFFTIHFNIICASQPNCRIMSMASLMFIKMFLRWLFSAHKCSLFFYWKFNFKMGLFHIQVNMVVRWDFLICITANLISTSHKLISGEKETLV